MFGKKARKRRKNRREDRQERKLERRQQRLDARERRASNRQSTRMANVSQRQDAKEYAYEHGIDPNEHWGDTLTGAGSFMGETLGGVADIKGAGMPGMLPTPDEVLETEAETKDKKIKKSSDFDLAKILPILIGGVGLYMFTQKK